MAQGLTDTVGLVGHGPVTVGAGRDAGRFFVFFHVGRPSRMQTAGHRVNVAAVAGDGEKRWLFSL